MKIETYYTAAKGSIGSFCHLLSSFLNRVSGNLSRGHLGSFHFFTPQTVLRRTSRAFGSARALDRLQIKILDVALLNGGRVFIFSGC